MFMLFWVMTEINAAFTKKEFKLLLEQVFVGSMLMLDSDEKTDEEVNALLQKLLRLGKEKKVYQHIDYDELLDELFMPLEIEEALLEKIDDYNEDIFLKSLVDEFVARDIGTKYNPRMMANMTEAKYMELFSIEEEKYIQEIDTNGLKNLQFI